MEVVMMPEKNTIVRIDKESFNKSEKDSYGRFITKLADIFADFYKKQYAKSAEGPEEDSTKSVEK